MEGCDGPLETSHLLCSFLIEVSGWYWGYLPGALVLHLELAWEEVTAHGWEGRAPICLHPQPSVNSITLPVCSTSSASWTLVPLCLPKFPEIAAEQK